ncbi:MAG: DUF1533 domain-containing protein, partial [Clostridia bacterium]|nr:DUF1533 domain-containing protein [Clostridia bacterium]
DSSGNVVGQAVEITFTDDPAWRAAVTEVTVNGSSIAGQYTLSEGLLTIQAEVFPAAGDYSIVVKAAGYADATVTQRMEAPAGRAVYVAAPLEDAAYQIGATADGIKTMTVKPGVSGLKYFAVRVTPQTPHEGREAVVFVHTRSGVQASLNATKADFDLVAEAQAGFNVQPGDVVKVYIVDDLTNA